MQIVSKNNPILNIKFSDESIRELDVEAFLKSMIKDQKSPYWEVLSPGVFDKVYVLEGKLVWENMIEAVVCSGELNKQNAEFSENEILSFILRHTHYQKYKV